MTDIVRSWNQATDLDLCTLPEADGRFPATLHRSEINERAAEKKEILDLLQEEIRNMKHLVPIPYVFAFADSDGTVLDYIGADSFIDFLESNYIKHGTSFSMKDAGINAISLSMESQSLSVVIGSEHSNASFAELACVCTPIRIKHVTVGYLGLSFHYSHEVTFAIPLIERLAKNIQEKLPLKDPTIQKELIYARFDEYDLTNREKEIAYGWLDNKSVPEIADRCGISPNTVRTFIKKIYAKTRVNQKGEFLKKFK
ncbi:LuxR C-terminal-related transcriptional regulator [Paenibacillus sp. GYB003]|uniref:LuxR C-terminal-related transcriptional regulator n=1 Tax=Paenibacillus sp. GYB003 TaxID=2994392 RepID=UPI002F968434